MSTPDEPLLKGSRTSSEVSDGPRPVEDRYRTGSFFGSVVNLCNNAIGSGVLVFPYAFGQTGLLAGLALSLVFCGVLQYTYYVVGRIQQATGTASYQELIRTVLGRRGERLALATQVLFIFGGCVCYFDIVADQVESVFQVDDHATRVLIIAIAACACLPLLFIKNMEVRTTLTVNGVRR
jgi:amino acid permease